MIQSIPVSSIAYLDVIAVVVFAAVVGRILLSHRRTSGGFLGSISKTIAASRRSTREFIGMMIVVFPLYYAWLWLWIGPSFVMPVAYYFILIVAALGQFTFIFMPLTAGFRKFAHQIGAAVVGVSMLYVPTLLLASERISVLGSAVIWLFYTVALGLLVLLLFPKYRTHTLLYEVIFCAVFILAISIAAHSSAVVGL